MRKILLLVDLVFKRRRRKRGNISDLIWRSYLGSGRYMNERVSLVERADTVSDRHVRLGIITFQITELHEALLSLRRDSYRRRQMTLAMCFY